MPNGPNRDTPTEKVDVYKRQFRSNLDMCGRYALYGPASRIREQFDLDDGFDFEPRYNLSLIHI